MGEFHGLDGLEDAGIVKGPQEKATEKFINRFREGKADNDIHVCDPGKPVVVERLEELKAGRRELASMRQWYRSGITQAGIDSRQKARRARLASLGLRDGEPTTPVVASSPPVRARPRW